MRGLTLCMALLACVLTAWPVRSSDGDRALPAACRLFSEETAFVNQTLYMKQEDVRHELRIPLAYFEDRWDRIDGAEHEAQLLRVMIDEFTPVTRPETAQLNKAGRRDYMNFVLHDLIPLDERLPIDLTYAYPGAPRDLNAFEEAPAEFGLVEVVPTVPMELSRQAFVARDSDNELTATLICSRPQDRPDGTPMCSHDLRAHGIDIRISYPREFLNRWTEIQDGVSDFIGCAKTQQ